MGIFMEKEPLIDSMSYCPEQHRREQDKKAFEQALEKIARSIVIALQDPMCDFFMKYVRISVREYFVLVS